jgi:hypothetical protein
VVVSATTQPAQPAPPVLQATKAELLANVSDAIQVPVLVDGVLHAVNASIAEVLSGAVAALVQRSGEDAWLTVCEPGHNQSDSTTVTQRLKPQLCSLASHSHNADRTNANRAGSTSSTGSATPTTTTVPAVHLTANSALVRLMSTLQQAARWKRTLSATEGNALLGALVRSGEPFLVARMGLGSEPCACEEFAIGRRRYTDDLRLVLRRDVGVYPPTVAQIDAFAEAYLEGVASADVVVRWGDHRMPSFDAETFVLEHFAADKLLIHPRSLEPYYHMRVAGGRNGIDGAAGGTSTVEVAAGAAAVPAAGAAAGAPTPAAAAPPWTQWLANRRVLVVHPFKSTIESQYARHREQLFPSDAGVLPQFAQLTVVPCVQSAIAETPHANWSESLEEMKRRLAAAAGSFDVALLGCGGYGLPMAAYIRNELNKSAVYLGGAVQVLFGIRGRRWDSHPVISGLYNDHWVRPAESERPPDAAQVEGGCYW